MRDRKEHIYSNILHIMCDTLLFSVITHSRLGVDRAKQSRSMISSKEHKNEIAVIVVTQFQLNYVAIHCVASDCRLYLFTLLIYTDPYQTNHIMLRIGPFQFKCGI